MPKTKQVDWDDVTVFDKTRCILYLEYTEECFVFKQKANELLLLLEERFPNWSFAVVKNMYGRIVPRPGSFEVSFSQNAKIPPELLWSGVNKGPPRADKFPKSFEEFIPRITALLKKFYVEIQHVGLEEENHNETQEN